MCFVDSIVQKIPDAEEFEVNAIEVKSVSNLSESTYRELLEETKKDEVLHKLSEVIKKIPYVKTQVHHLVRSYWNCIDAIVEVLNLADRSTEKTIIETLEEEDPELAEEIKKRMFVFEDIVLLDDKSIQKVLREVDSNDLSKALKSVDDEVQEKIFRNMSKRAASLLKEDMEYMGPIRLHDVEEAQQKVVNIIRKLEEDGEIVIARAGEDEMVV